MSQERVDAGAGGRSDLVDEKTIEAFVGRVEPGDEVSLAVVLWSVGLSLALLVGTTIWWVSTH